MSSAEIPLQQKYLLSFFTTTLLITLTTQSSLAFSITPIGPRGAITWDPEESYTLQQEIPKKPIRGTTKLNPTTVRNLTRGGSAAFLKTLNREFPSWTFSVASRPLSGSFDIETYAAIGKPGQVGAVLQLKYYPGVGDPTPQNSRLNWIQRAVTNHTNHGNEGDHGDYSDTIDYVFGEGVQNSPFYFPMNGTGTFPIETNFATTSWQVDSHKNHNWLAELYLVEQIAPQQVRIYNGIQWGWQNRVESVPEPFTIFGTGVGIGFGALFKRTVKKAGQNKTKTL